MNWKIILGFVVVFILGLLLGNVGTKQYDPEFTGAVKTLDSIQAVEKERKRVFDSVLSRPRAAIKEKREKLKQRQDEFKNDTIMPTDDELLRRARAVTNND